MIEIEDNNRVGQLIEYESARGLEPLAGRSISSLCSEYDNLLVFPHSIDHTNDRIGDSHIFDIEWGADQEKGAKLKTENIIGFIGHSGQYVRIYSRFDKKQNDYFLHYMLQRVFSFNLFDLKYTSTNEDVFNFLIFLFPVFLRRALNQGLYREYRYYEHNDSDIKGSVDVARHIKHNIPFTGKIAFNTREHSTDNATTQLVRHTIEYLLTIPLGYEILNRLESTANDVAVIRSLTPSYRSSERNGIISKNLRPRIHPYYTEYYPLQKLCLQILRQEEIKYGTESDEVYGVLFDGAWLWEEYINTIVEPLGFKHPENKLRKGGIYLFNDNTGLRFPDFYKDKEFVLDAKYKRYEDNIRISQIDPNDIAQVISYLHVLDIKAGGFVCPLSQRQEVLPTATLRGMGGMISMFGVAIPHQAESYEEFCEMMAVQEGEFVRSITAVG